MVACKDGAADSRADWGRNPTWGPLKIGELLGEDVVSFKASTIPSLLLTRI